MEEKNKNRFWGSVLLAASIAFGLLALGICIKGGIDNFANKDRKVKVKGLAERQLDADKVTWTMHLQEAGDDLKPIFASLNAKVVSLQAFLKEKGIEGKGTVSASSANVDDNMANAWGNNRPLFRYSVSRSVSVTSKDTKFIDELMSKTDELLERNVILSSSYANYEYTKFQELKPDMMAEAIGNAEKTAKQFAENSHSKINKIVEAGQGEFSIEEGDVPYKKNIRVVSTITYSLKD